MTNPYESPHFEGAPSVQGRGMVSHVHPIAILMMIQGGLEVLMVVLLIVLAVTMQSVFAGMPANPQGNEPSPEVAGWFMVALYGTMAIVVGLAAGLHIWAGIRIYQFRSRTLGIVSLVTGVLTAGSCYCFPTAIALTVYGMIVLLNRPVAEAFGMQAAGYKPDDIVQAFGQRV